MNWGSLLRRARLRTLAEGERAAATAERQRQASGEGAVPVLVGDQDRMLRLWRTLFDCGLFTNAVTQPAVAPGHDLIRTSYIASHTDAQIEQVLERFAEAGHRTGILGAGDSASHAAKPSAHKSSPGAPATTACPTRPSAFT